MRLVHASHASPLFQFWDTHAGRCKMTQITGRTMSCLAFFGVCVLPQGHQTYQTPRPNNQTQKDQTGSDGASTYELQPHMPPS